ncbi:MAG: glycerate kinase type-2 family protein [Chloroflexota bacterium]
MHTGGTREQLLSLYRDTILPLADAYQATRRHLRWNPGSGTLFVGDRSYPLSSLGRVFLVGAGKAGVQMARAVVDVLREDEHLWSRFAGGSVNVYREQAHESVPRVTFYPADHPTPNEYSVAGARAAVELLSTTQADDLVLAVISGGGSSLLTLPQEGMSLDDLRAANRVLVTGGPSIQEINIVRKHLCRVKGGGLRMAAPSARFATLILSDVIGDDLSSIASGPTVQDCSRCADAVSVLESYSLLERMPTAARACLLRPNPEEETWGARWNELIDRTQTVIVASNAVLLEELARTIATGKDHTPGLHVILEPVPVTGMVSHVTAEHARHCEEQLRKTGGPLMVLFGGEPVVVVPEGAEGTGGRMLHYALLTAQRIAGTEWTVLASGTDGIDGTAPAAGAVVDGDTARLAAEMGLDTTRCLERFDSYGFFRALEECSGNRFLNAPGPTGTNVNDIMLWSHGT